MGLGKTNRRKGNDAERFFADFFRKIGFDKCQTARYGSRMHDDAGIDLIHLPLNVQVKAGKQAGMKPENVIADIKQRITQIFPEGYPEHENPLVIIHKRQIKRGARRKEEDTLVHMSFDDFTKLLNMIQWE